MLEEPAEKPAQFGKPKLELLESKAKLKLKHNSRIKFRFVVKMEHEHGKYKKP